MWIPEEVHQDTNSSWIGRNCLENFVCVLTNMYTIISLDNIVKDDLKSIFGASSKIQQFPKLNFKIFLKSTLRFSV